MTAEVSLLWREFGLVLQNLAYDTFINFVTMPNASADRGY